MPATKECDSGYRESSDTTVKVKLWAIFTVIISLLSLVCGSLFTRDNSLAENIAANGNRITRLEIQYQNIDLKLGDIKDTVKLLERKK